jgi:hypothetical protein
MDAIPLRYRDRHVQTGYTTVVIYVASSGRLLALAALIVLCLICGDARRCKAMKAMKAMK